MARLTTRSNSGRRGRSRRDERGAVIVLFGLGLIGLLAMVAIVVDLGNARQQKRQLQSAVDSAALAGASHLQDSVTPICAAKTSAGTYAYNNLALGNFTTVTSPCTASSFAAGGVTFTILAPYTLAGAGYSPNMLLRVDACRNVPTSFARAIGFTSTKICAHASALKTGNSSTGTGTGTGTGSGDPDAPCTVDNFLPTAYFDKDNPPNGLSDPTADANHSGTSPGGPVGEGKIVGATFFATSDIDLTTNKPYFYLQNNTSGVKTVYTYVADNNPSTFHIHLMTQVKPNNVAVNGAPPANYLYQIQWKIPSGNANNSSYTIGMGAYETTQTGVAGNCGKTTWQFNKGTPPSGSGSGGSTCGEDAFLNTLFPSTGTAGPGDVVGANYQDESILNTNPGFQVDFRIDKGTANEVVLAAPGTGGGAPEYQLLPGPIGKEKFSTLIQYTLPATMTNGLHTVYLKAYDGDQNASGGDCGIGNWNFTLSGGVPVSSRVKLVE